MTFDCEVVPLCKGYAVRRILRLGPGGRFLTHGEIVRGLKGVVRRMWGGVWYVECEPNRWRVEAGPLRVGRLGVGAKVECDVERLYGCSVVRRIL
jgi:hypothetical protein